MHERCKKVTEMKLYCIIKAVGNHPVPYVPDLADIAVRI